MTYFRFTHGNYLTLEILAAWIWRRAAVFRNLFIFVRKMPFFAKINNFVRVCQKLNGIFHTTWSFSKGIRNETKCIVARMKSISTIWVQNFVSRKWLFSTKSFPSFSLSRWVRQQSTDALLPPLSLLMLLLLLLLPLLQLPLLLLLLKSPLFLFLLLPL